LEKYVKIELTFGDKLKLLFFNLIPENKLIVKECYSDKIELPKKEGIKKESIKKESIKKDVDPVINKKEDFIPFFDYIDNGKSNF